MEQTYSFGYWLRRRRLALDLTQDQLARQVGCTVVTIKKLEADARRPSRLLAERLAGILNVPPEEQPAFLKVARGERNADQLGIGEQPLGVPPRARPLTALPAPASAFIGRERELAFVREQLLRADVRLLTLTGPGGTGKTRLALQVAAAMRADSRLDHPAQPERNRTHTKHYRDGVSFVNLAPISDSALVATAIAQVLDVRQHGGRSLRDTLMRYLCDKDLLLLLDNFEQVVDAAPLVADLLAAAPGLTVLVTSRLPLHVSGEHEVAVPPLALPDRGEPYDLTRLGRFDAVRLFVDHAQAVKADFVLTAANAPAVIEICHYLDGLPLAIELAAAWIKHLTPPALRTRLSSRVTFLTGGPRDLPARQQTIRNTLDWSYTLLGPAEQALFAQLSVFVGGWTIEAAEAVCDLGGETPLEIIDGIAALVDHSLLRPEVGADGAPRFTMLETIREYAGAQLEARGERERFQRRHAGYYLALVEVAGAVTHKQQPINIPQVETEHDNLRAALGWTIANGETELALRLAGALGQFWSSRGYLSEGRRWLDMALQQPPLAGAAHHSSQTAAAARAKALVEAAWLANLQADLESKRVLTQEALKLYREIENPLGVAVTLSSLGALAYLQNEIAMADALFADALALRTEYNGTILNNMGWAKHLAGDHAGALPLLEASLRLQREHDPDGTWAILHSLGTVVLELGDLAGARALLVDGLQIARQHGDKIVLIYYVEGCARLAAGSLKTSAQPEISARRVARLMGAASMFRTAIGVAAPPAEQSIQTRHITAARAFMNPAAWDAEWAAGQALTLEQALDEALVAADSSAP